MREFLLAAGTHTRLGDWLTWRSCSQNNWNWALGLGGTEDTLAMDGLNVGPYDEMEIDKVNLQRWKALIGDKGKLQASLAQGACIEV
jgi:hypothetical protein